MNDAPVQEDSGPDTATKDVPQDAYRVLARKYRPSSFADLIGQEAMVKTLTNAIELDRIHQAYLLTGVRGVGKTTTARILARAFNYELPASDDQPAVYKPTIDMPRLGVHCQAIIESRHVDVIEMDAASHTGVDDVREIIESVRYKPVMARSKVYIIDEVHMLSKNAFNALLKTLEEPPEHVHFIFATTESEKIPVTVRSRCQRFDLRRVESGQIIDHLQKICTAENVQIEADALALIARSSEGSVRDSLSLLDQAIAMSSDGGGQQSTPISSDEIRAMLGIGSRARIVDLFDELMKGQAGAALTTFKEEYDRGADPQLLLADLAGFVHYVTRLKVAPGQDADPAITEHERQRGQLSAEALTLQTLTLAWQILSKGMLDVKESARPFAAAEMVLVRLAYAANLPSPEDVIGKLQNRPTGQSQPALTGARDAPNNGSYENSGARDTQGYNPHSPLPATAPVAALRSSGPAAAAMPLHNEPATPETREVATPAAGVPRVQLGRFEDIVALAHMRRDIQMKIALERDVHLVDFAHRKIVITLNDSASQQLPLNLANKLKQWTGEHWDISVVAEGGAPTLQQQREEKDQKKLAGVRAEPLVQSVLEQFPGAQIMSVSSADNGTETSATPGSNPGGDEVFFDDAIEPEDDDDK